MAERSSIKVHRVCSCREEDIDYVFDEHGWYELPDVICSKCGQLTSVEVLMPE